MIVPVIEGMVVVSDSARREFGEAYGVQVIWDDELAYTSDIYIEAGDHEHLIWLERRDFRQLTADS